MCFDFSLDCSSVVTVSKLPLSGGFDVLRDKTENAVLVSV